MPVKLRAALCLLLAAQIVQAEPDPNAYQTFDLQRAVELTLANNAKLLSLREETGIAEQRVRASLYLFFPKVDLNASATKFNSLRNVVLTPEFNSVILSPNDEHENLYTGRASLRQPLYTGGKSRYAYKLATVQLDQSRSQYDQALNDAMYQAKKAFYDLLALGESKEDAEAAVAALRNVRDRSRQSGNLLDRLRFESDLAELRRLLDEIAREWENQKLAFLDTLNVEHGTRFNIQGTLEELSKLSVSDITLAKVLAWAQEYRPEFRYEQTQAKMDALAVELALSERYPTVNLGALYEFAGHEFPLRDTSWATTIDFNLPFSWSSWSKIRQRRSEARQGYLKRIQFQDQIRLEVRQAYNDLLYWRQEKEKRQEEWKTLSELASGLARRSGSFAEIAEARRRLLETRADYRKAVHSYLVSYANIERVTGKKIHEQ